MPLCHWSPARHRRASTQMIFTESALILGALASEPCARGVNLNTMFSTSNCHTLSK
jgi:hypothetical protein